MRLFAKAIPVLLAAAVLASATPSFAGPAENAFLQKLTANWVGKGKISGQNGGPIACRIVVTAGDTSARYQGRCNIPDMATQAFNGAIVYNDAKKRYETRTVGGTVPGIKRGNSLVFTTKNSTMAGTTYSTMTISPSSLSVNFTLIDGKSGDKTTSTISFTK